MYEPWADIRVYSFLLSPPLVETVEFFSQRSAKGKGLSDKFVGNTADRGCESPPGSKGSPSLHVSYGGKVHLQKVRLMCCDRRVPQRTEGPRSSWLALNTGIISVGYSRKEFSCF